MGGLPACFPLVADLTHEVLELFKRLHSDGQTILMVTHNDEVAAAGDRIVRMRDGKVESDGRTAAPPEAAATV